MQHYAINVFWSDEDGAWIANVPDLKSCSAIGETPEAAVAEVRVAMEAWLSTARDRGMPIPMPNNTIRQSCSATLQNPQAASILCTSLTRSRRWMGLDSTLACLGAVESAL